MTAARRDELGPDGLVLPDVGDWAETKYELVETYSQLFTRSMRGKWKSLAYVDLFAAAGWGRVRGTGRIVHGTAFRALRNPVPFDRHVFCEADPTRFDALRKRVRVEFPKADARFLQGDSNAMLDRVVAELPWGGRSGALLTFCVADPSKVADLRFSTIERLAFIEPSKPRHIDFLVLIPSYMDAHRELKYYLAQSNSAIADLVGNRDWRDDWADETERRPRLEFGAFVVDAFGRSMERLGYLWNIEDAIQIGSGQRKFYHLAFFSRHNLGRKFAREARKYATSQLGFQW